MNKDNKDIDLKNENLSFKRNNIELINKNDNIKNNNNYSFLSKLIYYLIYYINPQKTKQ